MFYFPNSQHNFQIETKQPAQSVPGFLKTKIHKITFTIYNSERTLTVHRLWLSEEAVGKAFDWIFLISWKNSSDWIEHIHKDSWWITCVRRETKTITKQFLNEEFVGFWGFSSPPLLSTQSTTFSPKQPHSLKPLSCDMNGMESGNYIISIDGNYKF